MAYTTLLEISCRNSYLEGNLGLRIRFVNHKPEKKFLLYHRIALIKQVLCVKHLLIPEKKNENINFIFTSLFPGVLVAC